MTSENEPGRSASASRTLCTASRAGARDGAGSSPPSSRACPERSPETTSSLKLLLRLRSGRSRWSGRRVARQLDCSVTGVIGVLLRAKELGRIEAVTPLLESMQSQGYWLSDEIIEHARELADEAGNAEQDND